MQTLTCGVCALAGSANARGKMTTGQSYPQEHRPAESIPGLHAGPSSISSELAAIRRQWISATLDFDILTADKILSNAFATYPPEEVCLEVLLAGLREIGDMWYAGEASVHQEHFASALAMRRVGALVQSASVSCHTNCILVVAPPSENHSFNLLLLTFLLLRRGQEVAYLGINVPLEWMDETIKRLRPRWLITASQYLPSCAGVLKLANFVKERGVPLGYGGLAFNLVPVLRRRIPGQFLGERLEEVPQRLESLERTGFTPVPTEPLPPQYQELLPLFHESELLIRGATGIELKKLDAADERLVGVGRELGRHLIAALETGAMEVVGAYIHWLRGRKGREALPYNRITLYVALYAQAVRTWLGSEGAWVADYLKACVA